MKDIVTKLCCCAMFAACCMGNAEGRGALSDVEQRRAQNAINSINTAAVNIEGLTQSLLNGNQQVNDGVRGQLSSLQSHARNITGAYIPNLSRSLNNAGIRVNIRQNIARNAAGATVGSSLGSFRNYVNNIQAGVNNLNRMVSNLPQELQTAVNNNIAGIQQEIGLMSAARASLQRLTAPMQAQPNANNNWLINGVTTRRPAIAPSSDSDDDNSSNEEESEPW